MRDTFLPFSPPLIGEEEIQEVVDTLRSGWITTGPKVRRFEEAFARYVGAEGALAVSSASKRLPTVAYCYWGTPFTLRLLGGVLWRPAAASLLAGWATWLVHGWLAPGAWPPLALAASLPIFAGVYLLALLGLPGGRALVLETLDHLRLLRGQPAEALG